MKTRAHRWASGRLERWCDDELSPVDLLRIADHLRDCEDCRDEIRFLLDVKAVLRGLAAHGNT